MTAARQILLSEAIKTVLARHNLQDNVELEMELQGAVNRALATEASPSAKDARTLRKLTLQALADWENGVQAEVDLAGLPMFRDKICITKGQ